MIGDPPDVRMKPGQPQRLTELLMAIALATDLGMGQPLGHALRTSYLGVALARELGCTVHETRTVFQVALLRFLGCTADAAEGATLAGGDDRALMAALAPAFMGSRAEGLSAVVRSLGRGRPLPTRARLVAHALADRGGPARSMAAHCEVAAMLARRLGLNRAVAEALAHGYERWDGRGHPAGLRGTEVPVAVRIAVVARDAELFARAGERLGERLGKRAGRAYDPQVVAAFESVGSDAIEALDGVDVWHEVLATEPEPVVALDDRSLDDALAVFADYADLKSPWTRGHSTAVADLAARAASAMGLTEEDRVWLRRAGLVHDLGRVGIENGIWDKPGKLSVGEWERVRLHPYLTQRVLEHCSALAPLVATASDHHERLDGSGYHRGRSSDALSTASRLLAVADVFAAATAQRPHRPALSHGEAARLLEGEARDGRVDAAAVDAVLAAAGVMRAAPRRAWPGGLTSREVEVLQLIARGGTNRYVARLLGISPKTVGRHIENIYGKIGVRTRAGAALFAMEQRLLS